MQYMILIHTEPFEAPAPGQPGFAESMAPWQAFNQRLVDDAVLVAYGQLDGTETATTIRRAVGAADVVVDGPFAETTERFGGYYLIEVPDLTKALELATAVPVPAGSIEVRPVLLSSHG